MPRKKTDSKSLGNALLQAHVSFMLDQLTGEDLLPFVEALLDVVLEQAATIDLETAVSRDLIKDVARQYALDMDYGGGIPELAGDVARAIHASPAHQQTRLGQLLSDRRFKEVVDHLLSLTSVRERLIHGVVESALYEELASDLLYNGIRGYVTSAEAPGFIPGAKSAFKLGRAVVRKAAANIEDAVEENIKRHIGRSVRDVSLRSIKPLIDGKQDQAIRDGAADTWAKAREIRVGDFSDDLSDTDLEELFVTLYECWKDLRQTDYLRSLIDTGIDAFFDKYGQTDLAGLLEDLSIDRTILLGEATRFGPPVLEKLRQGHQLEAVLTQVLRPFYESGRVEEVLSKQG